MVWGNLVSATGSGLACPDWPLCHGTVAPPLRGDIILEWGHRLLAASAGVLILLTVFFAFRLSKHEPALRRLLRGIVLLLAFQILLGGTTVLLGLSVTASTIHLLTASFVFGGLIAIAVCVSDFTPRPMLAVQRLRVLAVGILIQFLLGGLLRHTHAGLACPNFPLCLDSLLPEPALPSVLLAWTHRWFGVALAVFALLMGHVSRVIVGLAWAQVLLGVLTVLGGLDVILRSGHAALGYLLFGMCVYELARRGGIAWLNPHHQAQRRMHSKT